jgi:AP-1-like factor
MDPLTPNTSAFLSYLSSNLDDNSINTSYDSTANPTPASFPPSAFFPMPGRDTPEDTPPSSVEASQSPEKITDINRLRNDGALASGSDYDGNESTGKSAKGKKGNANHKRKAVRGQHKDDAEDEDDEGESCPRNFLYRG